MTTPNGDIDWTDTDWIAQLAAAQFPEFGVGSAPQAGVAPVLVQVDEQEGVGASGTEADSGAAPNGAAPGEETHRTPPPPRYIGTKTIEQVRADFPILEEIVDGNKLVWFDNAATTQRPTQVIERLKYYYEHENSNIHRAAHTLAARSTDAYEAARRKVADFIGAGDPDEIVFVRGTTEGINLLAQAVVKPLLTPGDEIIVTNLEHHANIVPWQIVAAQTGAVIKVAPVDDDGQVILGAYSALFTSRTKFVSFAQVSNATGTVTPCAELIAIAHAHGVLVAVDGAQSISHLPVNVRALDADFFVFSGHKIFGPTGIGAVYGRKQLWDAAQPYQGGGNMIVDVTFERTVYAKAPAKFEAGTGNIADAVGLGAALDYVSDLGIESISAYEHWLHQYATDKLSQVPGLHWIGTAANKASILSFVLDGHSVPEVGQYLSRQGIAVRAGHHCAQPILRRLGVEATVRASLAFYNTADEVDFLAAALHRLVG
ncbi:MAG: cysteine desulfurase [Propionibacteriaceae bacterium]|jgi:cysteine desulfurase/selenocysteine lyase|nr:cysteine desulfurase [Propionibacteriaceae bacterium]